MAFLFGLKLGSYSEDDICKLSVLTRATSPESAQALIPLKCTTKKICLSDGKGKCDESFSGEEKVEVVKLPSDSDKAARIIEETSAEAMYQCWDLMGQGKIDIFGSYAKSRGREIEKPVCVICSRVAIDKNVNQETIGKSDIYNYMRKNRVPGGSLTYLQAFTDKEVNSYSQVSPNIFKDKIEGLDKSKDAEKITGNGREIAFIFMQIKAQGISDVLGSLGKDGLIVAGGAFLTPGINKVTSNLVLSKSGSNIIFKSLPVVLGLAGGVAVQSAINAYSGQMLAAGYCGSFATNPNIANDKNGGGKEGCSIIQAMPYDFRPINGVCDNIEGSP